MYNDGYVYPKTGVEVNAMMRWSLLVYTFAELRKLARRDSHAGMKVDENGKTGFLTLPKTALEIAQLLKVNEEVLRKRLKGNEASLDALEEILNRPERTDEDKTVLVHFSDEYAKSNLVYGIAVDTCRKRITVSFRGSISLKDWLQDFKFVMQKGKNPLKEKYPDLPEDIYLHKGFDDYLNGPCKNNLEDDIPDFDCKFLEVMHNLKGVINEPEYAGFKIYVTGHSLGGALSTLFSFQLAAEATKEGSNIQTPISNISIASPYVGDNRFRESFMKCEKEGLIRHIRVCNKYDIVALGNPPICIYPLYGRFKHVGVNFRLYENEFPNIGAAVQHSYTQGLFNEMINAWHQGPIANLTLRAWKYGINHKTSIYCDRIEKCMSLMNDIDVNKIYEEAYKGK